MDENMFHILLFSVGHLESHNLWNLNSSPVLELGLELGLGFGLVLVLVLELGLELR